MKSLHIVEVLFLVTFLILIGLIGCDESNDAGELRIVLDVLDRGGVDDRDDDDDHDELMDAVNVLGLAFDNAGDAVRPSPSFDADILPILTNRCAFVGCHAAGGQNGIDLRTYNSLRAGGEDGAIIIAGNARSSDLVEEIVTGRMPPGGPPLDIA